MTSRLARSFAALQRRALFALVMAAITVGAAGAASADVLVSNMGQTARSNDVAFTNSFAQGFRTGTNSGGYNLTSVELEVTVTFADGISVTLWSATAGNKPDSEEFTFTNPGSLTAGRRTFTAPANTTLAASTRYFVRIGNQLHGSIEGAAGTGDDSTTTGWTIDDKNYYQTGGSGSWLDAGSCCILKIQVNGSAATTTTNAAPTFTSSDAFDAAENATAAGTVEATDADSGDNVTYEITGGADQAKFSIGSTSGALTFNTAPNYESPTDAASTTPSNAAGNNEYIVAVTATGGTGTRAMTAVQTITVTVTNQEEAGTVALSAAQPVVGTALTATLTDPDDGVTGTTWVWEKSADGQSGWTAINGATAASYTPVTGDVGNYLRATASYTDGHGSGKTAHAVSAAVLASAPVATKPAQVTGLTATANAARTGVVLAWTTPTDGGSAITRHEYQRKGRTGSYGSWTAIATSAAGEANVAGFTVTGLTNSRNYTFKVRAVNAVDNGDASAEASAATVPDAGKLILTTETGRRRNRFIYSASKSRRRRLPCHSL